MNFIMVMVSLYAWKGFPLLSTGDDSTKVLQHLHMAAELFQQQAYGPQKVKPARMVNVVSNVNMGLSKICW